VIVALSPNSASVSVSSTLTFTTANYNVFQNATVTALPDADNVDGTATISLGTFAAPELTTVSVTVVDPGP
jgi:hypothetical protein